MRMIKVSSLVLALSVLASRWLVSEAWAAERPALPPLQMVGHSLADWLSRVPPWALVIAGCLLFATGYFYYFSKTHVGFFLVQGLFGLLFFLYLARQETRERLV